MKKYILSIVLISIFISYSLESKSQFTFSVSPGINLNGAGFGYKINNFVPYIGLQGISGTSSVTEKGMRYEFPTNNYVSYEEKYKFSGNVFMPTIGVKYFFMQTNKLKAYGTLSFTKFLFSAKIEDSIDSTANDDLKKALKEIKVYGAQLGFGAEYFFDDNFSVGGEFGIRQLHVKYKEEHNNRAYDPNTNNYIDLTTTYDYKLNLYPTYVKLSFNFYFGK